MLIVNICKKQQSFISLESVYAVVLNNGHICQDRKIYCKRHPINLQYMSFYNTKETLLKSERACLAK